MDYAQRKRLNLGELIHETLEILEAAGRGSVPGGPLYTYR